MKVEGRIEISVVHGSCEGVIAIIVAIVGIIILGLLGLQSMLTYGGSFCEYLFCNYWFYFSIGTILIINTLLFCNDVSVMDTTIVEALIGFATYIILGCYAYSQVGTWDSMSGMLEKICSFLGIIWLSVFFVLFSILVCIGIAVGVVLRLVEQDEEEQYLKSEMTSKNGNICTQNITMWTCHRCGTKNMSDTSWCTFCGRQTR